MFWFLIFYGIVREDNSVNEMPKRLDDTAKTLIAYALIFLCGGLMLLSQFP